jgi:rRNA maturation endonuclease Nob1
MPNMVGIPLGEDIYIGRDVQRMPRVKCTSCGRMFWSMPFIDKGECPECGPWGTLHRRGWKP